MRTHAVRRFAWLLLAALLASMLWSSALARSPDDLCSWIAGPDSLDYLWSNPANWSCNSTPTVVTDVVISAANASMSPMVTSAASARSVTVSGNLRIAGGATLAVGAGGLINLGNATIDSQGTLAGSVVVAAPGVVHFMSSGTIAGSLAINSGATANVDVIYMLGNVVNNGTLSDEDLDGQFFMRGQAFANTGMVSISYFHFDRGGGAAQQVAGGGSWGAGLEYIYIENHTHLLASSNISFSPQHFLVGSDDLLDTGSYQTTFKDGCRVDNAAVITGAQGGSVHTQGSGTTISMSFGGSFTPPLVVDSGATWIAGTYSGPVTVQSGATLRVLPAPAGSAIVLGDVTVNGNLGVKSDEVIFEWQGQHMTVNGSVGLDYFWLNRPSLQSISGSGALDLHILDMKTSAGLQLGAPLAVDQILYLNGNIDASSTQVTLAESAQVLGSNSDKDIFGVVRRNGPLVKDTTYCFGNRYLAVTFTQVGGGLPSSLSILTLPQAWAGLPGSIRRSYSIQSNGGSGWTANLSLDYRQAELSGMESYLRAYTRSSASTPWAKKAYTLADDDDDFLTFDGLTHFSEWALVIQQNYLPAVLSAP